jgi:hypothetical protein
VEEAPSKK